ncbi:MAG: hypothetical protein C9356_00555 [Oleiphilus sp.]|nr:MAG: hypothetical protein C9356_00555 [Oleiphilus sp.]
MLPNREASLDRTSAARKSLTTKGRSYVNAFHFDSKRNCYCRSGKLFGQCCGPDNPERSRPRNIHVVNNFVSRGECHKLVEYAEKQKRAWLPVLNSSNAKDRTLDRKLDTERVTEYVKLGHWQMHVRQWMRAACARYLGRIAPPQWFESPQLLRYGVGGKYDMHSDAEHFDRQCRRFYRHIDRDFSMLIYLNDRFSGGTLNFPWLGYRYQPVAGDLVFFPSNHIFTHESLPVTAGVKYALVSWGVFQCTARVNQPLGALPVNGGSA